MCSVAGAHMRVSVCVGCFVLCNGFFDGYVYMYRDISLFSSLLHLKYMHTTRACSIIHPEIVFEFL